VAVIALAGRTASGAEGMLAESAGNCAGEGLACDTAGTAQLLKKTRAESRMSAKDVNAKRVRLPVRVFIFPPTVN